MTRLTCLICVLLLGVLSGCDDASMMKQWIRPADEQVSKGYINLLRQHSFEQIEKDIDPSIKTDGIHDLLTKGADLFPPQEPLSVKVVGLHTLMLNDVYTSNIMFEYEYPNIWLLAHVAVQKKDGVSTIVGIGVQPIPDSLEVTNKFTLVDKSALQYSVLIFAVLEPLFIVFVLVQCIRTKIEKRKWLWILFILFGIGQMSIDWASGQWSAMPVSVHLLGVGAFAQPYGPWTISVTFPLGAILFLLWKNRKPSEAPTKPLDERMDQSSDLGQ